MGTVSVIIPTYNGERFMKPLLESLKSQTAPIEEIIVIDSSSKDSTARIAESMGARVKVIPQNEFDHGGTRTQAAQMAKGEYLVFLTQDALPVGNEAVADLVNHLTYENTAAVFGRQLPAKNATPFAAFLRLYNYPVISYKRVFADKDKYGLKTAFFSDTFSAYHRPELEAIGWFDKGLLFGEDTIAAARLLMKGYKIAYASEAQVYHSHNYSAWQEFRRYFDVGAFHIQQKWLLDTFGKAESEGFKFVKEEWKYLRKQGKAWLIPVSFFRSGMKYLGYLLGKKHARLPRFLTRFFSMHRHWWR